MTKEEKLTVEFIALRNAIKALIEQCPEFPGAPALVNEVAVRMANVESHSIGISTVGSLLHQP